MGSHLGVVKTAARRIGLDLDEYTRRVAAGERWCFACKAWHPREAFSLDRSRSDGLARACRESRNARQRSAHVPVPPDQRKPRGPAPQPPREGDVQQARQRVNVLVRTGRLAHPNTLPCADCGHVWIEGERRHEYDHHLGYGAAHHLDVEIVCTVCHSRRSDERGETGQIRGPRGTFIKK